MVAQQPTLIAQKPPLIAQQPPVIAQHQSMSLHNNISLPNACQHVYMTDIIRTHPVLLSFSAVQMYTTHPAMCVVQHTTIVHVDTQVVAQQTTVPQHVVHKTTTTTTTTQSSEAMGYSMFWS